MAIDCIPCGTGFPVEYLQLLNCNNQLNTRKAGIDQIAFLKCDQVITDMTDATEWDDIRTDVPGGLLRIPNGAGSWPKPSSTSAKIGCNESIITDKTLVISYSTFKFDNDTFTDLAFMCKLNGSFSGYKLLILGCDQLLYFSDAWATGANPGVDMTLLEAWDENPETGLKSMKFEITLNILDVCFTAIKPSLALKTAIFAGTSNTSGGG